MKRERMVRLCILLLVWAIGSILTFGLGRRRLDLVQDVLAVYAFTMLVGILLGTILFGLEYAWFKVRCKVQGPRLINTILTGLTLTGFLLLWFPRHVY